MAHVNYLGLFPFSYGSDPLNYAVPPDNVYLHMRPPLAKAHDWFWKVRKWKMVATLNGTATYRNGDTGEVRYLATFTSLAHTSYYGLLCQRPGAGSPELCATERDLLYFVPGLALYGDSAITGSLVVTPEPAHPVTPYGSAYLRLFVGARAYVKASDEFYPSILFLAQLGFTGASFGSGGTFEISSDPAVGDSSGAGITGSASFDGIAPDAGSIALYAPPLANTEYDLTLDVVMSPQDYWPYAA